MTNDGLSWHGTGYPELRDGPPWVMEEMIAAAAGLAVPIAGAPGADAIAAAVVRAASAGEPIVVTGCGTSEHGALAVAALLDEALRTTGARALPEARQALDAALDPRAGGICIGISHDGTTRATILALEAAARRRRGDGDDRRARATRRCARRAEHVLVTPLRDRSWCHTVAYTSTILAGAAIARADRGRRDRRRRADRRAARAATAHRELAAHLHGASRILAVGLGADLITARELALKIEEGARIPATALHLESLPARAPGGLRRRHDGPRAARRRRAAARAGATTGSRARRARPPSIGIPAIAIGGSACAGRAARRRRAPRSARRRRRGGCAAHGRASRCSC